MLYTRLNHVQNLQSAFSGFFITLLSGGAAFLLKEAGNPSLPIYEGRLLCLAGLILSWGIIFSLYQTFASRTLIEYLGELKPDPRIAVCWYFSPNEKRGRLYRLAHSFPAWLGVVLPIGMAFFKPADFRYWCLAAIMLLVFEITRRRMHRAFAEGPEGETPPKNDLSAPTEPN